MQYLIVYSSNSDIPYNSEDEETKAGVVKNANNLIGQFNCVEKFPFNQFYSAYYLLAYFIVHSQPVGGIRSFGCWKVSETS